MTSIPERNLFSPSRQILICRIPDLIASGVLGGSGGGAPRKFFWMFALMIVYICTNDTVFLEGFKCKILPIRVQDLEGHLEKCLC